MIQIKHMALMCLTTILYCHGMIPSLGHHHQEETVGMQRSVEDQVFLSGVYYSLICYTFVVCRQCARVYLWSEDIKMNNIWLLLPLSVGKESQVNNCSSA